MASRPSDQQPLLPFTYMQYPLGSVQPLGWIEREIQLSAKSLAGHLFYFYRFVHRSTWLGGECEYTALNEAAPYWYNYAVPLAYNIHPNSAPELRARILSQAQHFLTYTLDHQAEDGWLGPELSKQTRGIWARCLLLQGMINHALADQSQYARIVTAIVRFTRLIHSMLADNLTGYLPGDGDTFDPQWFGVARAHELSLSLQWLHGVLYDQEDRRMTWEVMEMLWQGARKVDRAWTDFFTEHRFPRDPPVRHDNERASKLQHGVNVAQGLRYPAQLHRMHPSDSLRRQPLDALKMVLESHGTASGSFTSDEYIGGLSPQRGVEVCCTVELMHSLAYLYSLLGDAPFADRLESAAFNAFPVAISEDWWSHQYVTQLNQPWACELQPGLTEKPPYYDVCRYANVYGLEPEFPCCTVNHPAAFPRLAMSTFLRFDNDDPSAAVGILHAVLIAGRLCLPERTVICETSYPFDPLRLDYTIRTSSTFILAVRIPDWCTTAPTTSLTGDVAASGSYIDLVTTHERQLRFRITPANEVRFQVTLHADVSLRRNLDGTVNIHRGPLLYAYPIPFHEISRKPRDYSDQSSNCADVPDKSQHDWMQNVRDHDLTPMRPWGVALDISKPIRTVEQAVKFPSSPGLSVWSSSTKSTYLEVTAFEIEWPIKNGTAADPKEIDANVLIRSGPFTAKLVPFASAKLHLAQFPVVDSVAANKPNLCSSSL